LEDLVPSEYYLSQNYPDPFQDRTTIKYCLPERVKVKLELFDSEERKVKTLVDEVEEAGTYKVDLSGEDLQEGYYYYKLEAGSPSTGSGQVYIETKKMVLLR